MVLALAGAILFDSDIRIKPDILGSEKPYSIILLSRGRLNLQLNREIAAASHELPMPANKFSVRLIRGG